MAFGAAKSCNPCTFRHIRLRVYLTGSSSIKETNMPARFAPYLFGLILSGLMSGVVSGIATLRNVGLAGGVTGLWLNAWVMSWVIAFPVVLLVAPVTRRLVARMVRS
jgi:hypothetical protein